MIHYKILKKGEMVSYGCTPNDIGFKLVHADCLKDGTLLVLISKREYDLIDKEANPKPKKKSKK